MKTSAMACEDKRGSFVLLSISFPIPPADCSDIEAHAELLAAKVGLKGTVRLPRSLQEVIAAVIFLKRLQIIWRAGYPPLSRGGDA